MISISGCSDRRSELRQHQYVVSLNKALYPHCYSRLSCEMSTMRDHLRLFNAINLSLEIELKNQRIFFIAANCEKTLRSETE